MASHLTYQERQLLSRLKKERKSNAGIARFMGRHRSTIYRELDRNAGRRGYGPRRAQRLAEERRLASRRPHQMDDPDVHQYVQERLKNYWSPDQIAGRVRRDFPRAPTRWLSRQTIYTWIHRRRQQRPGAGVFPGRGRAGREPHRRLARRRPGSPHRHRRRRAGGRRELFLSHDSVTVIGVGQSPGWGFLVAFWPRLLRSGNVSAENRSCARFCARV